MNFPSFLFLFLVSAYSQMSPFPVSVSSWDSQFWKEFSTHLCKPDSYYRKCIEFGDVGCKAAVQKFYFECKNQKRLPSQVRNLEESQKLSQLLATCVSEKVEASKQISKDSSCQSRNIKKASKKK